MWCLFWTRESISQFKEPSRLVERAYHAYHPHTPNISPPDNKNDIFIKIWISKMKNSNFLSNIVKNSPKTIHYEIANHSTIFLIHAIEKFQMKKKQISRDTNRVIKTHHPPTPQHTGFLITKSLCFSDFEFSSVTSTAKNRSPLSGSVTHRSINAA